MNRKTALQVLLALCGLAVLLPSIGSGQEASLQQGIAQYRQENYEEALELFLKARQEAPDSSQAAFFLGLTYKQIMDYPRAAEHFRDAVTLTPKIKEALVELIETLYRMPDRAALAEAWRWVEVAQRQEVFPAKIAFLKGLMLQREQRFAEAAAAFERAKAVDPALAQAADVQIALSYVRLDELSAARDRFQAAVVADQQSDLAAFARHYQDLVEQRLFAERPWRFTLAVHGQQDSNVVLKPLQNSLAPGVTDEDSAVLATSWRVDWVPKLRGSWLFNAQYAGYADFHRNNGTTHDVLSNSVYAAPGYNFGRWAANLVLRYENALVKDPDYDGYVDAVSGGVLVRIALDRTQRHLLECYGGYDLREFDDPPLIAAEDRDGKGLKGRVGWLWVFREGGLVNLRYEVSQDDADGDNWESIGQQLAGSVTYPLHPKVRLQGSAQFQRRSFDNLHTVFNVKRDDQILNLSAGVNWEMFRNTTMVAQYTYTRADSNIAIYEYDRNVYSAGIEYRF